MLCFKSGLHMDYDGPALPVVDLWKQIIAETGCELIITTGTGGGVGANVLLGDVIVAADTVFDCKKQFAAEPFHDASYQTSPLPGGWAPPAGALLKPNADRVLKSQLPSHPDGLPAFLYPGSAVAAPKIVTTDFFAFDNTTNTNGLQALGNVCDMGDATLGLALSQIAKPPRWAAIRNASDPQIDGSLPPAQQSQTAGSIYQHFGAFTTAASVLGAWSVVCHAYPPPARGGAGRGGCRGAARCRCRSAAPSSGRPRSTRRTSCCRSPPRAGSAPTTRRRPTCPRKRPPRSAPICVRSTWIPAPRRDRFPPHPLRG